MSEPAGPDPGSLTAFPPWSRRRQLGDESRSLLRALLLCSIVEHRGTAGSDDHNSAVVEAERALARLEADSYGTCEGCGAPIPLDVLMIVPHARRCALSWT